VRAESDPVTAAARPRARVVALAAALLVATIAGTASAAVPRPPATDADNATNGNYGWFEAGRSWRGEFADPYILRAGSTFYAYSSGAGGRYLGRVTSHDLGTGRSTSAAGRRTRRRGWAVRPASRPDSIPAEIRQSKQSPGDIWNLNDALGCRPRARGACRRLQRVGATQLLGHRGRYIGR
jgi:hypothetical protein